MKEVNESVQTLFCSVAELESMRHDLESMLAQQAKEKVTEETKSDNVIAVRMLKTQTSSLPDLLRRLTALRCWQGMDWSGRIGYLIIRNELQEKLIETDRLLKRYRHIQQRFVSILPVPFRSHS